jgi:hypothetical protein
MGIKNVEFAAAKCKTFGIAKRYWICKREEKLNICHILPIPFFVKLS